MDWLDKWNFENDVWDIAESQGQPKPDEDEMGAIWAEYKREGGIHYGLGRRAFNMGRNASRGFGKFWGKF